MGQQQLLLVILVTIIVGIATVVAINIFGTAADQANQDAVRQDLLSAASAAQGLFARPEMMGGAGSDFANVDDIRRLNIPRGSASDMTYTAALIENDNGSYTMANTGATVLTLTGDPNSTADAATIVLELTWVEADRRWDVVWTENL